MKHSMSHSNLGTRQLHHAPCPRPRPYTWRKEGHQLKLVMRAVSRPDTTAHVKPARTCTEAVVKARQALRSLRDARSTLLPRSNDTSSSISSSLSSNPSPEPGSAAALVAQSRQQLWVTIELPLPVKASLLTSAGVSGNGDVVRVPDEGDWPGGMQQRFRALRPLVEGVLEGYDWKFLGLLESDADGVGLWSTPDMTIIGSVTSPTFPALIKLLEGGYGSRVTQPGHIIVAVNPQWGSSRDVGQPWDRSLREKAAALLGECGTQGTLQRGGSGVVRSAASTWLPAFVCRMVRGSRGSQGLIHRAWPGPWQVYATPMDNAEEVGPLVLQSCDEPSRSQIIESLQGVRESMQQRALEIEEGRKGRGGGWPWG